MINLNVTVQEAEVIIVALRKGMPMEVVEELVMKLRAQALPQIQALQAPPEAPAEETTQG